MRMSRHLKQTREKQHTPAPEREKSFEEKVQEKAGELIVQAAANERVVRERFEDKVREKSRELLVQAAANEQAVAARQEEQRIREEQTRRGQIAASLPHSNPAEEAIHSERETEARKAVVEAHKHRNGAELLAEIDKKRAATLELAQRVAEKIREYREEHRDDKDEKKRKAAEPTHSLVITVTETEKRRFRKDKVTTSVKEVEKGWLIPFTGKRHPGGHMLLLENGNIMSLRGNVRGVANGLSAVRTQEGSYGLLTPEFESDMTRPIYTPPVPEDEGDWQTIENRGIVVAQHEAGTQHGLIDLYTRLLPGAPHDAILPIEERAAPPAPAAPSSPPAP